MRRILAAAVLAITTLAAPAAYPVAAGLESDLYADLMGGYHGSLWFAHRSLRLRGVIARFPTPEFRLPVGAEKEMNDAKEAFVDFFFNDKPDVFEGAWVALGVEKYEKTMTPSEPDPAGVMADAKYEALDGAARAGYAMGLFGGLYLNPWLGFNKRLDGDDDVLMSGTSFRPKEWELLASVKLGYQF